MEKKKVLVVFGTRPEAIKMAPVVHALQSQEEEFSSHICVTGQHRHILDQMLDFFQISPDVDLDIMSENQSLESLTAKAITSVGGVLGRVRPDVTLVQGDTTTAMAAGLASFYARVPVGHVEAGLRTGNSYDPFPEEINRRLLTTLSTFHFAPTPAAAKALLQDGVDESQIYVTGNTVIDALLWGSKRVERTLLRDELEGRRFILVTAHRRENFGDPVKNICTALQQIVRDNDVSVVYPVHPNPNIRKVVFERLQHVKHIHLIEPLEYKEFIAFMKDASLLLTDSGGVQEEAPTLGKPVLVLRKTTERPEAIEAGVARLVGTEVVSIVDNVEALLNSKEKYDEMANRANPFGDGTAAEQITAILKKRM